MRVWFSPKQAHAKSVAATETPSTIDGWWSGDLGPEPQVEFDENGVVISLG